MDDQRVNTFFKNSETVTILPASYDTRRETGISWYEVRLSKLQRRVRVIAFNQQALEVGVVETQLVGDREARATISENDIQVDATLVFTQNGSGQTAVQVCLDNDKFSITRHRTEPHSARPSGRRRLVRGQSHLPKHWNQVIDPLATLAEALTATAADSNSWGCTSCMVLLGSVTVGTFMCLEGALATCPGNTRRRGTIPGELPQGVWVAEYGADRISAPPAPIGRSASDSCGADGSILTGCGQERSALLEWSCWLAECSHPPGRWSRAGRQTA